MSIENNLASIAKSLSTIAEFLENEKMKPSPVVAPAQPIAIVTPDPTMPAFVMPATVEQVVSTPVSTAPFNDAKGLIAYVMDSYKALGTEKGAQIQGVLSGLGYHNINDVKPESYGALYSGVEALK